MVGRAFLEKVEGAWPSPAVPGPPRTDSRQGGRATRGSGSAGSGGCGRWLAAGVQGMGVAGGAAWAQPCVTVRRGPGQQGVCLVGAGAGGGAGACTPLEGRMTGGRGQRGGRAPGRGSQAPKGGGARAVERDEGPQG